MEYNKTITQGEAFKFRNPKKLRPKLANQDQEPEPKLNPGTRNREPNSEIKTDDLN